VSKYRDETRTPQGEYYMRADLFEAKASISWAFSQLISFDERLEEWLKENVQIEIRETPPPATHNPIVAVEKELLPFVFSVEAGAYINAIRSSLDILAMVLVCRHSLAIAEDRVSFPFFRSHEAFVKQSGSLLLQQLPDKERGIITSLKPYPEGNPALWALHHLDIVRKHRRLLDVQIRPIHLSMKGTLTAADFQPLATGTIQVNEETVLGLIRKGVPQPSMQSRFFVAMNEARFAHRKPVLGTLAHLADVANAVIALFDD
jgi:hypothetical protein